MIKKLLTREFRRGSHLPEVLPAGEPLATLTDVSVRYGNKTILDDVNLAVHAGETVGIVGPNGAGKSTILSVIAGDVTPASGQVHLDGTPLGAMPEIEIARRRAVLPQKNTVTFPFTVRQVVQMGRSPWARTENMDNDEAAIEEAMAATGVDELYDRPMSELSGGEAARVAMARTLAQQTQLLLLDEPTAALDIHYQELCLEVMQSRVAAGAGALVVLHDLDAAAAYADRVVIIAGGRIAANGPPSEVFTPELLFSVYHHPVDVMPHPLTGNTLVLPRRSNMPDNGHPKHS